MCSTFRRLYLLIFYSAFCCCSQFCRQYFKKQKREGHRGRKTEEEITDIGFFFVEFLYICFQLSYSKKKMGKKDFSEMKKEKKKWIVLQKKKKIRDEGKGKQFLISLRQPLGSFLQKAEKLCRCRYYGCRVESFSQSVCQLVIRSIRPVSQLAARSVTQSVNCLAGYLVSHTVSEVIDY